MNENSNRDLVTVMPNEEGVSWVVVAYKDVEDSKMLTDIQLDCTGAHLLESVEDLAAHNVQALENNEIYKTTTPAEQHAALRNFKRMILFQAAKGAGYTMPDLISDALDDIIDALSDDPEGEE